MARAVYHGADISLLDDCLSAVDAHVGRELFDKCIVKTLLGRNVLDKSGTKSKKTVVLVTNALQYLNHPMVDRIVVLEHGVVAESGSYKDLSSRKDSQFQQLLRAFADSMSGDYGGEKGDKEAEVQVADESDLLSGEFDLSTSERHSGQNPVVEEPEEKKQQKLMSDEMAEREIGKVGLEVYLTWANAAGGFWVIPMILVIYSLGEATTVLSNWWLTYWSHSADASMSSQLYFLGIYGAINLSAILAEFLRQIIVVVFGLQASKTVSPWSKVVVLLTSQYLTPSFPLSYFRCC